jgi:thiol-disulfide isomerase/thioredoxin
MMNKISPDSADALYNQLSGRVKQTAILPFVRQQIDIKLRTGVGAVAPAFNIADIKNRILKSEDFKGKYLLLDFWASWCVPCRKQHPRLKEAYEKYNLKGFEILSVSIDEDSAKWKTAITEDGIPWNNARDTNRGDARAVSKIYGVIPIPANFLISPEGRIVAINLDGDGLLEKLQEFFTAR